MLRSLPLPETLGQSTRSPRVERFLVEAARRIDEFLYRRGNAKFHSFVSSNFPAVDDCLSWIVDRRLPTGQAFCEWGSGYGIATMLAADHGFDACGIEVEQDLVESAQRLALDFEIPAQFVQGSFIPEQADSMVSHLRELSYVDTQSASGYAELGLDLDDFDVIYAYPWPGEERFYERLFDKFAARGALLMTYHGVEGLRLKRKVKR